MIQLNPRDHRPINEQIQDGLRRLILSGVLEQGDKMPSVRQLAASLAINPNTIQRAYAQLEAEGYLESYPGKGSFVAPSVETKAHRRQELLEELDRTVEELVQLGMTRQELAARLEKEGEKR